MVALFFKVKLTEIVTIDSYFIILLALPVKSWVFAALPVLLVIVGSEFMIYPLDVALSVSCFIAISITL